MNCEDTVKYTYDEAKLLQNNYGYRHVGTACIVRKTVNLWQKFFHIHVLSAIFF